MEPFAQIRPLFALAILHAHFHIARETTGAHDDAAVQDYLVAIFAMGVHTNDGTVFIHDQAVGGGVGHDFALVGFAQAGFIRFDVTGADGFGSLVRAGPHGAGALSDFVSEFYAEVFNPEHIRIGVGAELIDLVQIADIVAAVIGLQRVELDGVEQVGIAGRFMSVKLLLQGIHQLLMQLAAGFLLGQRIRHIQRGGGNLGLHVLIGRVVDTAGQDGVAAERAHLFDDNHVRAVLRCSDRAGQAGAAAAHDNQISRLFNIFGLGQIQISLEGFDVAARLGETIFNGVQNRPAGERCAGHSINSQALVFQNGRRDLADGVAGNAGRFIVIADFDRFNLVFGDSNGNRNIAVHAERLRRIGTGRVGSGFGKARDAEEHHAQCQTESQYLLHVSLSY